jgi:hypothetical protein
VALTSAWLRQAFGAVGTSLLAPIVVLAAAGAVAIGGLGGLGSLGQVAGGPEVPDLGVPADAGPAAEEVELAAVDAVGALPAAGTGAGGAGAGAAAGPAPGTRPGGGAPPGDTPLGPTPPTPGAPPGGGGGSPGGTGPGTGPGAPPPTSPSPNQQITDTVRGIGEAVPDPLAPVTDEVLDTVLGPPPGR